MSRVTRAGMVAFVVAIAVIIADQMTKTWVLSDLRLAVGESRPIVWPLSLTLVRNDGVSFGFFQTHAEWTRWMLAGFSLVASGALAAWAWRAERIWAGVALGLVLGGAVGNLIDRVRLGAVVDFVDVQPLMFPWIFNVADSGINVGVGVAAALMLVDSLAARRKAGT